jgi:branched-chain amino acid transport system substrate-binding protein
LVNVQIAIDLPLGQEAAVPIVNGVRLAVGQAGGVAGAYGVGVPDALVFDDSLNGAMDALTGQRNTKRAVETPDVIALIGPLNSAVATVEIPVSSEAGLLQCSPTTTNPALTKPPDGPQLRSPAKRDVVNFIRTVGTDDLQGPAAARYIKSEGAKIALVVSTPDPFGSGIGREFAVEARKLGLRVIETPITGPSADFGSIARKAKTDHVDAVFFGGVTPGGAPQLAQALKKDGPADALFVGPDGIWDGSASVQGSFLNLAGPDVAATAHAVQAGSDNFATVPSFVDAYRAAYGSDPNAYAPTGYACAQVVLDALERISATSRPTDRAALREAVRAAAVDPSHVYDTILGPLSFDANGDVAKPWINVFHYDAKARDWAVETTVWFGD